MSLHPVPSNFALKKQGILTILAAPSSSYTDLSPKGSVDTGIKDLIDSINRLDGIVTTSSCAGRISVFLEGNKSPAQNEDGDVAAAVEDDDRASPSVAAGSVGGKGRGGRWLFVSHDPIEVPPPTTVDTSPLSTLFGLTSPLLSPIPSLAWQKTDQLRLVRFQFEPMILHIMTASLHHARSILAAAISAGFRESGVSSLKSLDDPASSFPTVAVRSSGLALGSLIGYMRDIDDDDEAEMIHTLVGEEHLQVLVRVANERFTANADRIRRFSDHLFASSRLEGAEVWEDKSTRQERKRAEGLRRQQEQKVLQP